MRQLLERQEAGEDCHDPLGCEVVSRHLCLPQMREELRHVELDQLGHLKVLEMQLRHSLSCLNRDNLLEGTESSCLS